MNNVRSWIGEIHCRAAYALGCRASATAANTETESSVEILAIGCMCLNAKHHLNLLYVLRDNKTQPLDVGIKRVVFTCYVQVSETARVAER